MIKTTLLFIFIFGLMSCKPSTESTDYFGQTYPDSIPEIFAPDLISVKGRFEHGISFTPDTRELAFGVLNKKDFSGEIFYSKKANNDWTLPNVFEPLKNKSVYLPYFSPDGKHLLYTQSKSDTNYNYKDIWIIEKNDKTWQNPKKSKIPLSTLNSVSNACMTIDETIYFSSNINCIGVENCHTADLFYSPKTNNRHESVKEISELISPNDEESVFISPKDEYLIFCRYTDNVTWMDLYISYRDYNNKWTKPQIVDSTINSNDWDRRPFVSIDNKFLFFTRLQIGEEGLTESDIYWVNTSKLFKPFVYNPLSDTIFHVGEKFEISVPGNYFKDIDDKELAVEINLKEYDWLEFNSESMKLSGQPTQNGVFELTFTAVDRSYNISKNMVKITVLKQ